MPLLLNPIIFLILVYCVTPTHAQRVHISGYLTDAATGESLPGAVVWLPEAAIGAAANEFGYYSLSIPANTDLLLVFQHVGYEPDTLRLTLAEDRQLSRALHIRTLTTVEVKASQTPPILGQTAVPLSRLRAVPVMLGEPDLFKSLGMLPGIATGTEGTVGLYVRGGSPDQNLVLLDGSTVYNNGHLFGFVSAFHPTILKDAQVYKGAFPARYGGRLSSVMQLTMKDGDNQQPRREASLGIINSNLSLEGPLREGQSSYIIGGRFAHSGLLTLLTIPNYHKGEPWLFAGLYDVNGKLSFKLRDSSRLSVSLYAGDDLWGSKLKDADQRSQTLVQWGNRTLGLRYAKAWSPRLFSQTLLNFNTFSYAIRLKVKDPGESERTLKFSNVSRIAEWTLRQQYSWALHRHTLYFGAELIRHAFRPTYVTVTQDDVRLDSLFTVSRQLIRPWSGAAYLEDVWKIGPGWELSVGLRWSVYRLPDTAFYNPEPRLRLQWQRPNGDTWQLAGSRMTQYVHLLTTSGTGVPNDLWLPATRRVPPQRSHILSAGWSRSYPAWFISLEGYYKWLDEQIDLEPGGGFFQGLSQSWETTIATQGEGRIAGVELLIRKDLGPLTGWLGYTYSWNTRRFATINNGEAYPFKFDRRHDLECSFVHLRPDGWRAAVNVVLQTGAPITLPEAVHYDLFGQRESVYVRRNNQRLPLYHRVDLTISKEFLTRRRQRRAEFVLGVYNLLGARNALYIETSGRSVYQSGRPVGRQLRFRKTYFFRFVPALYYSWRW